MSSAESFAAGAAAQSSVHLNSERVVDACAALVARAVANGGQHDGRPDGETRRVFALVQQRATA